MTAIVEQAIAEIRSAFNANHVCVTPDGRGGAYVIVEGVHLPDGIYQQDSTWVGFHIADAYPYADVYPHFVRYDLSRKDGQNLGSAAQPNHDFQGRSAVQLSRRSYRWDATTDTALLKMQKVIEWLSNPS